MWLVWPCGSPATALLTTLGQGKALAIAVGVGNEGTLFHCDMSMWDDCGGPTTSGRPRHSQTQSHFEALPLYWVAFSRTRLRSLKSVVYDLHTGLGLHDVG